MTTPAVLTTVPWKRSAPAACPQPGAHGISHPVIFTPSDRPDYVASAPMTFDEFLRLDYEHGLAEWVDGEVVLYMSAKDPHQRVVAFLTTHLTNVLALLSLGVVRAGPYAIKSPSGRAGREPDLFLIAEQHRYRVQGDFLDGNPDLVIEVVSDDSVTRDYRVKFAEYEAAGIPEYWIIDPRQGEESASFWVLTVGRYSPALPDEDGIYQSTAFPQVKLNVEWLFRDDPPIAEALRLCLGDAFGMPEAPRP